MMPEGHLLTGGRSSGREDKDRLCFLTSMNMNTSLVKTDLYKIILRQLQRHRSMSAHISATSHYIFTEFREEFPNDEEWNWTNMPEKMDLTRFDNRSTCNLARAWGINSLGPVLQMHDDKDEFLLMDAEGTYYLWDRQIGSLYAFKERLSAADILEFVVGGRLSLDDMAKEGKLEALLPACLKTHPRAESV